LLCEAAGYDRILVETVGVGQSEVAVDQLVDLCVLLTMAGTGDELQGMKRGIMEAADLIVLTKAEPETLAKNTQAQGDLLNALGFLPRREHGLPTDVLLCSARNGTGIVELHERLESLAVLCLTSGALARRREVQEGGWLKRALYEALLQQLATDPSVKASYDKIRHQVLQHQRSPYKAAKACLQLLRTGAALPL
jgi:LAO/AO transport system kinase